MEVIQIRVSAFGLTFETVRSQSLGPPSLKAPPKFLLGLQTSRRTSWPGSSGCMDFLKPCALLCKLPMRCVSPSEHREYFKCHKRCEHREHHIPARGLRGYPTRIHSYLVP